MSKGLRPSIRLIFASTIAGIALMSTLGVALLVGRETSTRLREEIGGDLAGLAHQMADTLDRGMFERWRDIQVAASLDLMRDPKAPLDAKRLVIERPQATYPNYAGIAFIGPDGILRTATLPGLEGANVRSRDFFLQGSQHPFVGDVHDAILLAKLLGTDPTNPPRFVDVAAPVRAEDGSLVGVISAHLYWTWANEMEQALREAARVRYPHVEVIIFARDGTTLLGPKSLLGRKLDLASTRAVGEGRAGSSVERWPDGIEYLSGYRRTSGYRDYPGLGWSVLLRQRADESFAPLARLQ